MPVGVIYDPIYLEHDTGDHPENKGRLEAIVARLKESGTWDKLAHIQPRPATQGELLRVHSDRLVKSIRALSSSGGGEIDSDTIVAPGSYDAALMAAGGVEAGVDAVMGGEVSSAFALVRPPGHHATRTRSMGFCLFNNVAVAAARALDTYGLKRILIIDTDVHHGNGTQDIFAGEPRVNYISAHQSPLYPGSGDIGERGIGNIFNIPLSPGSGDGEYSRVYEDVVMLVPRRIKPELIIVSAGFDAHWADELASMCLSITGYAGIYRRIKKLADELCGGRLVLTLEGGYNLAALAGSVQAVFDVLADKPSIEDEVGPCPSKDKAPDVSPLIARTRGAFGVS
jgi:acetoin utilization deacetylase AcuC-like enzyme